MNLDELYQELILDHNRHPRNFFRMENASHHAEGNNPLCGDHYKVFVKLDKDQIRQISFEGAGCAISKASASLMTEALAGKDLSKAKSLFGSFHQMMTTENGQAFSSLGKLSVFSGVREFPSRVKCAALAWHTFMAALESRTEVVSTENEEVFADT